MGEGGLGGGGELAWMLCRLNRAPPPLAGSGPHFCKARAFSILFRLPTLPLHPLSLLVPSPFYPITLSPASSPLFSNPFPPFPRALRAAQGEPNSVPPAGRLVEAVELKLPNSSEQVTATAATMWDRVIWRLWWGGDYNIGDRD